MASRPSYAPDGADSHGVHDPHPHGLQEASGDAPWLAGYDLDAGEQAGGWEQAEPAPVQAEPAPTSPYRAVVGGFLALLALLWVGVVAWAAGTALAGRPLSGAELVRWAALASGPLALIAIAWLVWGRSSRQETGRFIRAVVAMREENDALARTLAEVQARLAHNRESLAQAHGQLAGLGEEAAERLGAVTRDVDAGAQAMARYADALDRAAGSARTDMGVLLADLPRAERHAAELGEALREAGRLGHEGAAALDAGVGALTARAREADEAVAQAAGRLTAHAAQVGSAGQEAAERLSEATGAMAAEVDGVLARADEAMGAVRAGMDEQGRAMLALVDQSGAALEGASAQAARAVAVRVDEIGSQVDALAAALGAQDAHSAALLGRIRGELDMLEGRWTAVAEQGRMHGEALEQSLGGLQDRAEVLGTTLEKGGAWVDSAAARTHGLQALLDQVGGTLGQALPDALEQLEAQVHRAHADTRALRPEVDALAGAANAGSARLAEAEASLARQRADADALLAGLDEGTARAADALRPVQATLQAAREEAEALAHGAAPELLDALSRVRDAANQAAAHARDAISATIPDTADRLGQAAAEAMTARLDEDVAARMAELGAAADRALEAARATSERLTRQMLAIGETAAAVENRIAEHDGLMRERDAESFPRQTALLIESMNSTAIDVAKILSNEVTDSAWAAYLRGDRGVFTRRAVRLIDSGQAREIIRYYEGEPEFREQVNRYIHDFEALLRRVLGEPGGSALGVTLLGSDNGKLYVALAQAIERLRS